MIMSGTRRKPFRLLFVAALLLLIVASGLYAGRRLLHHFKPRPLLMAGQDHAVIPMPDAANRANPLEPAIRDARAALSASAPPAPTHIARGDYLKMVDGIVRHFARYQDASGAIIDPYAHREIQYSTPSYALAAAMLVHSGLRPELLKSASRALGRSIEALAMHSASDRTGDFFIYPTMAAYRLLRDRVDLSTRQNWERDLRKIDPDLAYSDRIGLGQPDVMNWNSNAILGEYLRSRYGFTDGAFVARYLDAQMPRFTPAGLYRDPGFPPVYDAAARFNFLMLLEEGYGGPHRAALETLLYRGAWASLLMQSPNGDFPVGGRSAGHVWNDAMQCAAFEIWARRLAGTNPVEAAAFKRAAHLAAVSAHRWLLPSGEFTVTKNFFDPARRFGYEQYSFVSQYNLLSAAYLALAWAFSDERVEEGAAPGERGDFLVNLPDFRKTFANFHGHAIEIDTGADIDHNQTGLLRDDMAIRSTLSTALPIGGGGVATGIAWRVGRRVEALAEFPPDRVNAVVSFDGKTSDALAFSVRYDLTGAAVKRVTEHYVLKSDRLIVRADVSGPVDRLILLYPAFLSNGRDRTVIASDARSVTVRFGTAARTLRMVTADAPIMRSSVTESDRYGIYALFEAATDQPQISFELGH